MIWVSAATATLSAAIAGAAAKFSIIASSRHRKEAQGRRPRSLRHRSFERPQIGARRRYRSRRWARPKRCVTRGTRHAAAVLRALGITDLDPPTPPQPGET